MKIFEKCPECSTIRPMPAEHVLPHPLDDLVGDLVVGDVPPPEQHVGLGEHLLAEAVLGVGEGRGADVGVVVEQLAQALGDGAVDAVRVDRGDRAGRWVPRGRPRSRR